MQKITKLTKSDEILQNTIYAEGIRSILYFIQFAPTNLIHFEYN